MNSTVWQIIKKDMRRARLALALWSVALVLRVSLAAWLGEASYDPGRGEHVMAMLLILLLNAHLVVRVLAEDSPLKEAAFWRMRPITSGQMLTAKVLFIAVWTVVLPVAVVMLGGWAYGFAAGECLVVATGQLVLHTVVGGVFLLFSIFTQRVWASMLGVWLAMIAGSVLMSRYLMISSMSRRADVSTDIGYSAASMELSRILPAGALLIVACGVAVAWVYRDRRRLAAAAALVVALVAAKAVAGVWQWDYLSWVPALQRLEARADPRYTVEVVRSNTLGRATLDDVRYRQVSTSLKWSGLNEDQVAVVYRVAGTMVLADGTEMPQTQKPSWGNACDLTGGLKALGVAPPGVIRFPSMHSGVTLAQIKEEDFARLKQAPAEWRGRIWVKIGKMEPEFRVPVKQGARFDQGADLTAISEVSMEGDRLRLKIHERHADVPRWKFAGLQSEPVAAWMPQSYALINLPRKESSLSNGGGGGGGTNDGLFSFRRSEVEFSRSDLEPQVKPDGWANWLSDAELVRFRFVEERRVVVDVVVPVAYSP